MTKQKDADFGRVVLDRIARLERRRGITLRPEQKILLAETGTVEQLLSILVGSAIEVKVVKQELVDRIIHREVLISATGRPLVRARSKIYCKFLPAAIVKNIMRRKGGIGTIIYNERMETWRRLVRFGLGPDRHPYRIYRIIHNGKTAFQIREDILL
jgi:chorismate-pyruvate lyase